MAGIAGAIALQGPPPGPNLFEMLVLFGSIFLIFYFLVIRPQQRRQKEHQSLLESLDKGDVVVTSGGLHGRVVGVTEDVLTLDVGGLKGERVRVKVDRGRVDRRVEAAPREKAKEKAKGS